MSKHENEERPILLDYFDTIDLLDQKISKEFVPVDDEGNEFDTLDETYQYVYGISALRGNRPRIMELDIQEKVLFHTQSGEQIEEEGETLQDFSKDTGMRLDTVLVVTRTVRRISTWESEVDFSFELYNGIS